MEAEVFRCLILNDLNLRSSTYRDIQVAGLAIPYVEQNGFMLFTVVTPDGRSTMVPQMVLQSTGNLSQQNML
jgi:hypothetical protein